MREELAQRTDAGTPAIEAPRRRLEARMSGRFYCATDRGLQNLGRDQFLASKPCPAGGGRLIWLRDLLQWPAVLEADRTLDAGISTVDDQPTAEDVVERLNRARSSDDCLAVPDIEGLGTSGDDVFPSVVSQALFRRLGVLVMAATHAWEQDRVAEALEAGTASATLQEAIHQQAVAERDATLELFKKAVCGERDGHPLTAQEWRDRIVAIGRVTRSSALPRH